MQEPYAFRRVHLLYRSHLTLHPGSQCDIYSFFLLMMFQVNREEKRLEQDFGEAYTEYKQKTKKLILYIW